METETNLKPDAVIAKCGIECLSLGGTTGPLRERPVWTAYSRSLGKPLCVGRECADKTALRFGAWEIVIQRSIHFQSRKSSIIPQKDLSLQLGTQNGTYLKTHKHITVTSIVSHPGNFRYPIIKSIGQ